MDVIVCAAEQGILGKILMSPGDRFTVGDTLAVTYTTPTDHLAVSEDLAELETMRVETNTSTETGLI